MFLESFHTVLKQTAEHHLCWFQNCQLSSGENQCAGFHDSRYGHVKRKVYTRLCD